MGISRRWAVAGAVSGVAVLGAGVGAWAVVGGGPSSHGASHDATTRADSAGAATAGTNRDDAVGPSGQSGGSTGSGTVTPSIVAAPPTSTTMGSGPPPPPTTTTTAETAPPGTLVLTQADAGRSYRIAPGQHVQVVLSGTGQQYHGFTTPQSDDTASVAPDGVACSAPSGQFCTEFVGDRSGSAQLTSTDDPACRQVTPPCELATQEWRVTLTVS